MEEQLPTVKEKEARPNNKEQEGAIYGEWQDGEFMEEDFWIKYLEERRSRIEKEEKEKSERLERAGRQEKSWDLARWCKTCIEETKSESWFRNKEIRKEQKRADREKKERFRVIEEKKKNLEKRQQQKMKQVTLLEMMKKLPTKEREILEMEERRLKRLELQEMKQNILRKWRGRKEKAEEKRNETQEEEIERKTRRIEEILQRIQEEKRVQDEKISEWKERRRKLLEEGRKKQEEKERKSIERKTRVEKKEKLEEKWEMLRWTISFIEEHKDRWESDRKERENTRGRETTYSWDEKTRDERIECIKEEWSEEKMIQELTKFERWRKYRNCPKLGPQSVAVPSPCLTGGDEHSESAAVHSQEPEMHSLM